MVSKTKGRKEDNLEVVEQALTTTERFIEQNQRTIMIVIVAILAVAGIFLGFKRFIVAPKEAEAQQQMFSAEQYFEKDSFNLALNGDGNYLGFLDIIDQYKITRSARLARYYTGISHLRLGQYNEAIDQLKKFKLKDDIIGPIAKGAIGDAYMELGSEKEAVDYYLEAARYKHNSFTTPIYLMKAAEILEDLKDYSQALELYNEVKKDFPQTTEGRKVDKYIARAGAAVGAPK